MAQPIIAITRRQAVLFACFLVLYEFLTYIANDMIMPGMISVVHSFNAPESLVATSLTLYLLGGASLQIILGPVSDVYGRRPMMLLGACLFFVFTILIASSHSMNQFMAGRFFQGMGLCFIAVIGYATIQEIFAEMDAIRIIAIMTNAAILAPLLGPLLGAIIIHYTSWRLIYFSIAFGALIALWGLWKYMPESLKKTKPSEEKQRLFRDAYRNYKTLFANRKFVYSVLAIGFISIPCLVWIALSPIIMIAEAKLSVIEYGLWQIPIFGATILGNWYLHKLTYKHEIKKIVTLGTLIACIGLVLTLILPYLYGASYIWLIPGTTIYFFALSVVNAPLNRYCLFVTNVSKGTASAAESLCAMVIMAIGIELANVCYKSHVNLNLGLFFCLVGLIYVVLVALTFYGEHRRIEI